MSFFKDAPLVTSQSVRLAITIPELSDLLTALLRLWGISPGLPGHEDLELRVAPHDQALHLVPRGAPAEQLPLPFQLESLWLALQTHLFDPPREHFRIPVRLRGTLCQGDTCEDFLTVSLSDAGLRFEFHRELVRDEQVSFQLPLPGGAVEIRGKIIYCIETRTGGNMIIGAVFEGHQEGAKEHLRDFLVESTLQQIRNQMGQQPYARALDYLLLPAPSRQRLTTVA